MVDDNTYNDVTVNGELLLDLTQLPTTPRSTTIHVFVDATDSLPLNGICYQHGRATVQLKPP